MTALAERSLAVPSAADRDDLATFLHRAIRLDEAAVVRLRRRGRDRVETWAPTGFEVMAVRVVGGTVAPADTTAAADAVLASVRQADSSPFELGFSMDSAWQGVLPPEDGFAHVDDVPAQVLVDLAKRGVELASEHSQGPPVSLLDQNVLEVVGDGGRAAIPMRMVFALNAMGFAPDSLDEAVRVRTNRSWLRLDARYGSVAVNRTARLPLSVR
ncbi:hypothetical protein GCM10007304_14930 [Rhodococcoides trifolii]|uniref:Uncharacterized protein n=1 Tax=Rhodococcoides trifolii TaxID=908250 RepID=A0A917CWA7_9NOCA|nr:hypothetical protein GCM10007304_14930 [Rhodococcus trifolii]